MKSEYITVYIAVLLFIAINSFLMIFKIFYLSVLPILLILFFLAITSLDKFFLITVFSVPLSIPLSFWIGKKGLDLSLPAEPFLFIIFILMFLKFLAGKKVENKILKHPVSLSIFFYLVWMFITSLSSTNPAVSFKFFTAKLWFICAFYFLAVQIFLIRKNFKKYIWFYIVPFSLIIVYVLIRHLTYGLTNQQASHFVVQPFYNDHTAYAAALSMLIPVLAGFYQLRFRRLSLIQHILFLLLIGLFIIAVIFSYSRAAWVSLIVASVFWLCMKLRIKLPVILGGFAILITTGFLFKDEVLLVMSDNTQSSSGKLTEHLQSAANIRNDNSNLERINRWNCAWRMFKEKPILGWGPGTYMFEYAPFQLSHQKTDISTNTGLRGNAHSEYLGILSESGLFGLIGFLLILGFTLYSGYRLYYFSEKKWIRIVSLSVSTGLVTYYIHGFLNNFLDTDKLSVLFWGFTAIIVALDIYKNDSVQAP